MSSKTHPEPKWDHKNQYYVIKRNRQLSNFDADKIAAAMNKAFLAVEGKTATASNRIQNIIQSLTTQVINGISRHLRDEGTVPIEDIQDQVELALMRAGFHKVARAYVLYREEHAHLRSEKLEKAITYIRDKQGNSYPLEENQLKAEIIEACTGLEDVNPELLKNETLKNIFDGISATDLNHAMILCTRTLIEKEPNYTYVAARLLLNRLRSEALDFVGLNLTDANYYPEYFKLYIEAGIKQQLLSPELSNFDIDKLSQALVVERDQNFTYLGLQTLYDRYFLHWDGVRFELPQAFFMRVSMGLCLHEDNREQRAIEFYNLLSKFDFMSSTPTLFNSGTLRPQLSSCFLTTIPDDLSGIYDALKDNALLSKFAGGLGNDWTPVRGMGSHIKGTNGKSQGVVPFLKVANDTLVACNQSGRRRGSGCAYLETWHIDIEEFLELRKNTGDERRRTHDMNTANWIPDEFMIRVHQDQNWTLLSPDEAPELHDLYGKAFSEKYQEYEAKAQQGKLKIWKQVSAVELWRKMLTMLFETGHPWLCFSGETKVAVADGRKPIAIKTLAEANSPFPVYSARPVSEKARNLKNQNQRYWIEEIKMATAFKTGTRRIVCVHLDDGSSFKCTEDHLLALKEGGYVRADLSEGLSLFPFNSWNDATHPNNVYIGRNNDPKQRQARLIWEFYNGKVPKGYAVDHIINGEGDFIENLQILSINEHNRKTSIERIGERNPFFAKSHTEKARAKMSAIMKSRMSTKYREYLSKLKGKKKPDRYGLSQADLIRKGREFYMKYGTLSNKVWRTYFKKEQLPSCGYILNRFNKWSSFVDSCVNNHKVVKVEKMQEFEDVYDLSVEDNHNFFIVTQETDCFNSGVLVHNCFKDPCNLRNPQQHEGVVHSSNLCTEITLNTKAGKEIGVCNLASINLPNHIKNGKLDIEKLKKTINVAMIALDNVIEVNYYAVDSGRKSNLRHRPVGLGIMGFQDALYKLGIPYASQEAVDFADTTQELISYYAISTSCDLAEERGAYPSFKGSLWQQGILPIDSIEKLAQARGEYLEMSTKTSLDWNSLRERVKKVGMRNSNTMAIAPTATISNICGVSQSIEPTYQNLFVKSNLSGEFTMINPYLVKDLKALELWDEVMLNDLKFYDGRLKAIDRIPDNLKELYATAFEIDSTWLVEAASRRQKWIDQAQSLNLYILEPSGRKLDKLYKLAWKRGLKTTYYMRAMGATRVAKSTITTNYINPPQVCNIDDETCEVCQ